MIRIYTEIAQAEAWMAKYRGCLPVFVCVLGFTQTGLIPGISAAGRTPEDRKYTACADAEFLYYGATHQPQYPLPPLTAGASPVVISRAVVEALNIPVYIFNAGLPQPPAVPMIDLGGAPAQCLSSGAAMELGTVHHLFKQGLAWGCRLAAQIPDRYVILSECVVGGTTTALAVLTGLGIEAMGKVNSSHPVCNHEQKWAVVQAGLEKVREEILDPLELVAALGDPMQVVVAGMAIGASRGCGVMLAGGTQMLAVYALMKAIAQFHNLFWEPEKVVVGTTRWVAEDPTGATVELARSLNADGVSPSLIATELSFADSRYPQLQAYEEGFVKEGVGAGAAAIAVHLGLNWQQQQLLQAIEAQFHRLHQFYYL
ncbi:nicotinate mononucleotide-dependent phosphoribosyltransferase CobT [Fortiea contorta]|uniref:nicotinate mononucleotide-dependent phosphoribosyltransferase CobT n=1 Tax=Fortiea contorta TaxID=1892405 RepID=UPI00034CCC29|nr:TIGR00303 family protein [Fortiea contorta]